MIAVEYKGVEYRGNDLSQVIKLLRDKCNLSLRDIATVIEDNNVVNISHETVRKYLYEKGIDTGRIEITELEEDRTYKESSDIEVAREFNLAVITVEKERKQHTNGKVHPLKLRRRRNWLSKKLFNGLPGPNFQKFLFQLMDLMPEERQDIIKEFYLEGKDDTRYERIYRDKAREDIKYFAKDFTRNQLVELGVIR